MGVMHRGAPIIIDSEDVCIRTGKGKGLAG